jgi:hypothetical protein
LLRSFGPDRRRPTSSRGARHTPSVHGSGSRVARHVVGDGCIAICLPVLLFHALTDRVGGDSRSPRPKNSSNPCPLTFMGSRGPQRPVHLGRVCLALFRRRLVSDERIPIIPHSNFNFRRWCLYGVRAGLPRAVYYRVGLFVRVPRRIGLPTRQLTGRQMSVESHASGKVRAGG